MAEGSSDRSARRRSHWSGLSKNATMAPEMRFRVVSLPATASSRKNRSSSSSDSWSPSISAWVRTLKRSWWGSIRFLSHSSSA